MWCGTSSSSGSSRHTSSTPRRRGHSAAGETVQPLSMVTVEVENRSGAEVDERGAVELARAVLASEGVEAGELGIAFVGPDESRNLKREHLGVDEATDVLSFPIDAREPLPEGMPRQLGDVVLCP